MRVPTSLFLKGFVVTATLLACLIMGLPIETAAEPGTIVIMGGGAAQGGWPGNADPATYTTSDWSYAPYSALVQNGDVTGDDIVKVALINTNSYHQPETERYV